MKMCPDCLTEKPLTDFYTQKSGRRRGHPTTYCKACTRQRAKVKYAADPERSRLAHREWVKRNRETVKLHKIKSAYGLTPEEYAALPQVCVICGATDGLGVDHSHQSGRVRGLLCSPCNKGLGFFRDDPSLLFRAAEYVLGVAKPDIFELTYEPAVEVV